MLRSVSWPAPPPLSEHLDCVWHLKGALPPGKAAPILPDVAAADVVLQLSAPGRMVLAGEERVLPARVAVGGFSQAGTVEVSGTFEAIGLHLPPACGCLLGTSAAALREGVWPLEALSPALDAALARWVEDGAKAEALWAVLEPHVKPQCDGLVRQAARGLDEGRAVSALADELGISRKQLTRRFDAATGVTPRDFVRFARFSRAWRAAAVAPGGLLADLAAEAGYADQPHLDRDFRQFAGAPPSRVLGPEPVVEAKRVEMSPPYKAGGGPRR